MALSSKRPSVRGKKRAQARPAQEDRLPAVGEGPSFGSGVVQAESASSVQEPAGEPSDSSHAVEGFPQADPSQPGDDDHDANDSAKRPSVRRGGRSSRRIAKNRNQDAAAVTVESSALDDGQKSRFKQEASNSTVGVKESAPLAVREASLSDGGEEPADFFDLGDLEGESTAKKRSVKHSLASAKPSKLRSRRKSKAAEAAQSVEASSLADEEGRPGGSSDRASQRPVRSTSRKATEREKAIVRGRKRKIAWAAAFSAFAIVAVTSGLLFWNAYLRYDDAADLRGEWQVSDGSMTVVIDESFIKMPDALAYEYELDTWEKTIAFSFEDLSGKGSYRFSPDRSQVSIQEGEGQDISVVVLVKVSDDESAEPHKGPAQVEEDAGEQGASESDASLDDGGQAIDGAEDAAKDESGAAGEVADGSV